MFRRQLFLFSAIGLASLTALVVAEDRPKPVKTKTHAMVYKPAHGTIWDPSVFWHDGKYYMFSMYRPEGVDYNASIWLATSADGVHWDDFGEVIPRARAQSPNKNVYKCFVGRCRDGFVMNFGAFSGKPGTDQDTLCFYRSQDLIHWKYVGESHPDPRWYVDTAPASRWDHMYMLPKDEGNLQAGFWGWVVACPKAEQGAQSRAFGMMESADGLHWQAVQPPLANWSGLDRHQWMETGGVERIGGRYYLIGGTFNYLKQLGYSMFTFVADSPTGPFKLDREAWRLCGWSGKCPGFGVQFLAAWARGNGELLISNYVQCEGGVVLLPLRKPVVDSGGHLRLGYWKSNEAAKGDALALNVEQCEQVFPRKPGMVATDVLQVRLKTEDRRGAEPSSHLRAVAVLRQVMDLGRGLILEGTIQMSVGGNRPSYAGFYLEEKDGEGTGILLEAGDVGSRRSHIGALRLGQQWDFHSGDETGPGCATVTGLEPGRKHTFRLWIHRNLGELYIDDMLMQTLVTRGSTGRVGFLVQNGEATVADLKAWRMNL